MRKIGFCLLFLISITVDLFTSIPCKAKNLLKNNDNIQLNQVAPQYYMTIDSRIPTAYYEPLSPQPEKIGSTMPQLEEDEETKFDYSKYPVASENYKEGANLSWY